MKTRDDAEELPGLAQNHEGLMKPGPHKKGKIESMAVDDAGSEDNKTGIAVFMSTGPSKRDPPRPLLSRSAVLGIKDNYKSLVDLLLGRRGNKWNLFTQRCWKWC